MLNMKDDAADSPAHGTFCDAQAPSAVARFKHLTRCGALLTSTSAIFAQCTNLPRKSSVVAGLDGCPEAVLGQHLGHIAVRRADEYARPAGSTDAIDFAGDDKPLQIGQQRDQMNIRNAQTLRELRPGLIGLELKIGETQFLRLRPQSVATGATADEQENDVLMPRQPLCRRQHGRRIVRPPQISRVPHDEAML